jgi:hypothetical protein
MATPNVQNQGGAVIKNAQIVPIIWGNGFPYNQNSPLPGQLLSFLQLFVGSTSPMMKMLQEYSTPNALIGPGSVANNAMITAPGNPPAVLLDSQIQSTLLGWILNQNGQTPNFPPPTANTLYVIFLPQSVTVFQDDIPGNVGKSCAAFGAYHWHVGNVVYAVINCCSVPTTPVGVVLFNTTVICSHEIAEAITDPFGTGWLDVNTNPRDEIGDICQGLGYPQLINLPIGTISSATQTFSIQAIWSQSQQNCVFGPPVKLLAMTLPDVVYGGQPVSGIISLSDPVPTLPAGGVAISLSADHPVVQFNPPSVVIAPGGSSASIAVTTVGVPQTVVVNVKATLKAQSIQHSLTVLPPRIATFGYTPNGGKGYQYPPNSPQGTLVLNVAAPAGGLFASVVSSEPLLVPATPDELPIPAGAVSPSTPFYLGVKPVGVNTPVKLTANVAESSAFFIFEVVAGGPPNIVVKSLTINPATVIGGTPTFAHFTLAAPVGPGGGSIAVSSTDPTVATVPASVPLMAGATGGSFTIHTKPLQQPIAKKHCTIIAAQEGTPAYALLTTTS